MAVEIEWIDSTSPAATGNKIYRDDIEIADIAKGVQFYSDDTVEAATEYKYEVQAHDGAGDETTQEVEGENMDYITTESSIIDEWIENDATSLVNEADDVSQWNTSTTTLSSEANTDSEGGAFMFRQVSPSTGFNHRAWVVMSGFTSGNTYRVTIRANVIQGALNGVYEVINGTPSTSMPLLFSGAWSDYVVEFVATSSDPYVRLTVRTDNNGAIGDGHEVSWITIEDLGVI